MTQAPPPPPPSGPEVQPQHGSPARSGNKNTLIVVIVVVACGFFVLFVVGILAAILVPALASARETATRIAEAANLRHIGQSMAIYADEHGEFPEHVGRLIGYRHGVEPEQFLSPRSNQPPPVYTADMPGGPAYKFGDFHFVYKGTRLDDVYTILAFGPERRGAGRNVLFGDMRTQWLPDPDFQIAVERDNEQRRATGHGQPIDLGRFTGGPPSP
ncbi:MAG: type II secretion system protein [Phycisphaeraceae bacterium]|nr:type II secretion system protein [Phycisphaeraceae bacterium]